MNESFFVAKNEATKMAKKVTNYECYRRYDLSVARMLLLIFFGLLSVPVGAQHVRLKSHHMLPPFASGHSWGLLPLVEKM